MKINIIILGKDVIYRMKVGRVEIAFCFKYHYNKLILSYVTIKKINNIYILYDVLRVIFSPEHVLGSGRSIWILSHRKRLFIIEASILIINKNLRR